jgi:type IV pilus assembly protein PilY1
MTKLFSSWYSIAPLRVGAAVATALLAVCYATTAGAQTTLADQPVFSSSDVPGNLALALSVEFPTAISVANIGAYTDSTQYLGYFDPAKCYTYVYNAAPEAGSTVVGSSSYFKPAAFGTGTNGHSCSGNWSGNFMNWAAMQTIDPFRWALTGGYRNVDTSSQTILEKAWGTPPNTGPSSWPTEGSAGGNFNYRGTSQGGVNNLPTNLVQKVTPFTSWSSFDMGVWGNGNTMVFSGPGSGNGYQSVYTATGVNDLTSVSSAVAANTYRLFIRVDVCDSTTALGAAGLESNCVQYPPSPQAGPYHYKPEGLMQQYSNKIRFAAFSYLNGLGMNQQGGVLREPMGFIGPTYPQPLSTAVTTNTRPEWDGNTGIMNPNPDTVNAGASGVSQSGVLNYLNKFGESAKSYMTYDNVAELYYAAVRYYENLGNVSQWYSGATAVQLDGFPAVAAWQDPIAYSCQQNFILGIGDDHTWYDTNVGGGVSASSRGPMPPAVAATPSGDTFNQADTWTRELQTLEGIAPAEFWPLGDTDATYYIAGLAYGTHVTDIRPDLTGTQTISTFWMDVEEGGGPENLNPYYLATKYGGFTVPASYTTANTTPLTTAQFDTTGLSIPMNGGNTHLLPDNYYLAGNAGGMVAGLKSAFKNIANASAQQTTSFSFSSLNITSGGTESFGGTYNPTGWTGTVNASTLTFDPSGNPVSTPLWTTNTTLQTQLAGTGWQQTSRRVATWNGTAGIPFEAANLSAAQRTALTPTYSPMPACTAASCPYLNYLRGDQTNEVGSTATGSTHSLRTRSLLLGDIVDASLTPVTTPLQTFSDATNPGYAAFVKQWTTTTPRPTMVYAGANDGMLHAFVGATGLEQFAYVPGALFQGPDNLPQIDGLAGIGNPNFVHHNYVDATPLNYDIDLHHTNGVISTTSNSNWRTLLIGGLGKGGKSFYAIDITDPTVAMGTETAVAGKVMWEFTDPTMGFSFGAPVVIKTAQYGWVVALTSGYDNADGYGYLYLLNPATGALLQPPIRTPSASAGLTQASAFVKDFSDDTADSIYVGDLNGQLWRFDLTAASGNYPVPTLLATLADSSGNQQPITTAPLIEIHPTTRLRYVMVGTGQLLSTSDVVATKMQSFYVILDGTAGGFLPVSTPISRANANLTAVTTTNLTTSGITLPATSKGYYLDLSIDVTSGIAWRIILNPQPYNGIVAFTDLLTTSNACSPGGNSRVYAFNYATATSVLQPSTFAFDAYANDVVNLRIAGDNGSAEIIVGFNSLTAPPVQVPANLKGAVSTRILNWREVPTAQ